MLQLMLNFLLPLIQKIAWLYLVILCWILALTVLLPLTIVLTFDKGARRKFFTWYFVKLVSPGLKIASAPARDALFQCMRDRIGPKESNLEVLEIGVGEGANLQYYPENVFLTALDVNEHFEEYFLQNSKKYQHFHLKRKVIQSAEDMNKVEDESMDFVISTYLHCSCDVDAVLREVKRVLKPGGIYMFLDHVGFPKTDVLGCAIQMIIQPLWYVYGGGCILNKDIKVNVRRAGFHTIVFNDFELDTFEFYLIKHQVIGVTS